MSDPRTYGGNPRGPLRRDRESRGVAGVCGGLGRHLGIDPVVFRILFVVFSFVGGLGLLAYAAAWLFVPAEGAARSEAHRMLTGNNPWLAALVAIGLGLGGIAAISALRNGIDGIWPMWLIAAAVFGVLVWRGDIKLGQGLPIRLQPRQPTWWQQPVRGEGEAAQGDPDGGDPNRDPANAGTPESPGTESVRESVAEPRDEVPPQYTAYTAPPGFTAAPRYRAEQAAPVRTRRRGYGGLVLANLLAVAGILGVLNAAGAIGLTWLSGGALVLLLLGGGMVIGGFFGKTTGLVPIGLVLAVPLILLSAIGVPLHGEVGDEHWAPASAAQLQPAYRIGVGDGLVDLTNAAPGTGQTVQVVAQIGIGDMHIIVPKNVEVQVHAHDGIGSINADPLVRSDRWNYNENFVIPAGTAHPQGTIVLTLDVGIGDANVEVAQ